MNRNMLHFLPVYAASFLVQAYGSPISGMCVMDISSCSAFVFSVGLFQLQCTKLTSTGIHCERHVGTYIGTSVDSRAVYCGICLLCRSTVVMSLE